MKTLYLDCQMGAAGDMLMAALLELIPDQDAFLERLNRLGIPGIAVACERTEKCGITGSHISVSVNGEEESTEDYQGGDHDHHHHHDHGESHDHVHSNTGMHEIEHLVTGHLQLSEKVRSDVLCVYQLIAEAESTVHGEPVDQIHFSEVGSMDAAADIIGVCMLMEILAPDQVIVSPVHVGSGQVRCAHGILPVPAPATAYILRGIPIYGGSIKGELCTPTGAALLKHFAVKFGSMPVMSVSSIGYGMGTKNFEAANCVRALWGETFEARNTDSSNDKVSEISCNLDDMTPESIGYVQELLFKSGALDVYTIPIGMKKSRPGILLCCMCEKKNEEKMTGLILRHTATLGVRVSETRRIVLPRSQSIIETPYGPVRMKTAVGNGFEKTKPEYEDIAKIALENDMTLNDVLNLLR